MLRLSDFGNSLLELLERGGPVLAIIAAVSIVMWALILERYWYLYVSYPRRMREAIDEWRSRSDHDSWYAHRIREGLMTAVAADLRAHMLAIRTLTMVLPLLGLLGTVTGMIKTFDVIMVFGTGNARGLAAGISEALLTTTAGLVTAIAGLYFGAHLRRRAQVESNRLADRLV